MKNLSSAIVLAAVTAVLSGCGGGFQFNFNSGPTIVGSGVAKTEAREIKDVAKVRVKGNGKLNVKFGDKETLTVEADDNLLEYITSEVSDGELVLGFKSGSYSTNMPVKYELTVKKLNAVSAHGASSATVEKNKATDFNAVAHGASEVTLAGEFQNFEASVHGASNLTIVGSAKAIEASIHGASTLAANEFSCEEVDVECHGASTAKVHASKSINGALHGASTLIYSGEATVDVSAAGASSIRKQ